MSSSEHLSPGEAQVSQPARFLLALVHLLGDVRWCWAICLAWAGVLAWGSRHFMHPDGLSYVDMSSNAATGGMDELINGYWSPGYPALLAVAMVLFRPSPEYEFPLVHFVNFIIFVLTLCSFSLFFKEWTKATLGPDRTSDSGFLTAFGYGTFLWFSLKYIGMLSCSPDLGVVAILLLAATIVYRLDPEKDWKGYALLGLVLGIGYYIKAVVFPLGVALIAILFLLPRTKGGLSRPKLLISFAVFLALAAPLVGVLSSRVHRLTFGETSRLNYLWYANGLGWSGGADAPEAGTIPEHPAPKLLEKPVTLVFAAPVKGTYPLWYDPSYWYAGTKARFNGRFPSLPGNVLALKDVALESGPLIMGAIVLAVLMLGERGRQAASEICWWQIAWPCAAILLYLPIHLEGRFLAIFLLFLVLACYGHFLALNRSRSMVAAATALCAVLLPFANTTIKQGAKGAVELVHPISPDYVEQAAELKRLGLTAGAQLAVVGDAHECYYARCARLRVTAQVTDSRKFWTLTPDEFGDLLSRLKAIGIRGVIVSNRPRYSAALPPPDNRSMPGQQDWHDLPGAGPVNVSVLILSGGSE